MFNFTHEFKYKWYFLWRKTPQTTQLVEKGELQLLVNEFSLNRNFSNATENLNYFLKFKRNLTSFCYSHVYSQPTVNQSDESHNYQITAKWESYSLSK